jgi:hypothetical protein
MTFMRSFATLALAICLFTTAAQAGEPSCPGGYSNQFRLSGQVQNPDRFRLIDLQYRPASRLTVSYFSGSSGLVTKTYIGVPLIDLLNDAVIITDPSQKNDILRKYMVVRATDCYEVIVAVAELLSTFSHQQVLVAFETGDGALGCSRRQGGRTIRFQYHHNSNTLCTLTYGRHKIEI